MTESRPDAIVHQAFFGWSHDAGKLALLAHSFPRHESATRWLHRLESHLRLQPVPGTQLPPYAMSYFDYGDGSVAILRRVNAGPTAGRNNSHALIGSSEAIGIPVALAVERWPGWRDTLRPGRMGPIPATNFAAAEVAVAERLLRLRAERLERQLGAVLTRILGRPHEPLSIIGCRDEDRLAMVWGLREAADGSLRQRGVRRSWSFSTYEDRHDASIEGLPEIVFLPAKPAAAAVVRRTVVDLDTDPPVSAIAGDLIAKLLHGTPLPTPEPIGDIRMTTVDPQPGARHVRCPICADEFDWPTDPTISLYDEENSSYQLVDVSALNPTKRADLARRGYRQCPNPSRDTAPHYLPATYADYRDPLVIGLVGAPASGKTHLLTAMIRQAYRGGLGVYGVSTSALDFRRHAAFTQRFIKPFEKGDELPGTGVGMVEAADILLLRGPGGARPVTFFDVAGEDLESTSALNRATRFLVGANAVIFVYASEDPLEPKAAASENRSFDLAVERMHGLPGGPDRLPAVIAVTKSDRLRYVPPADRWLRQGEGQAVDADRARRESRDVYGYLHHAGAGASLRPFEAFTRCTLHFVSASGGDAIPVKPGDENSERYFPRGVRPTRVLEPLVSILAMTGMITGLEAKKVGVP